ncbi:MAG: hypothetical protein EOL97_12625 [Spirochaetia bacterium]|nr:hypothetical protein [Spirochaetia bacterium]
MKKQCKIHLLPSNETPDIGDMIQCINPAIERVNWKGKLGICHFKNGSPESEWKKVNICITDDSEIKEGDYTIYCNTWLCKMLKHYGDQVQVLKIADNIITTVLIPEHKKIIATTDSLLQVGGNTGKREDGISIPLPQIPKQFVEYWIGEYNKENIITDILVEFEQTKLFVPIEEINMYESKPKELQYPHTSDKNDLYALKISPTNEIYIEYVEEKMYSREDLHAAYCAGADFDISSLSKGSEYYMFENWIKENIN